MQPVPPFALFVQLSTWCCITILLANLIPTTSQLFQCSTPPWLPQSPSFKIQPLPQYFYCAHFATRCFQSQTPYHISTFLSSFGLLSAYDMKGPIEIEGCCHHRQFAGSTIQFDCAQDRLFETRQFERSTPQCAHWAHQTEPTIFLQFRNSWNQRRELMLHTAVTMWSSV